MNNSLLTCECLYLHRFFNIYFKVKSIFYKYKELFIYKYYDVFEADDHMACFLFQYLLNIFLYIIKCIYLNIYFYLKKLLIWGKKV